jgi:hypothetical protein
MRFGLTVLLALASAGGGVAVKTRPAAAPEPLAWMAARALAPTGEALIIGGSEGHRMHLLATGDGDCILGLVALDAPEEVLPAIRRALPAESWDGARLWLGELQAGVPGAVELQLRRMWMRLRDGAAPRPALVLPATGCAAVLAAR